ncbi:rRNA 2'-O-methyltransferase fibrillarin-like [Selaginella moellendorffii]|uniref:rRNA 2'-O-methyltransferase fibrillarin-like n=1 Tax=Selaginella moellendorffii TaxID=88036 RepID=UPI000D1C5E91|nr:rRNA 2'-O-methyltransferase fibrillarin-like [Selaginella moellendorffii]|eukprot:XP_024517964.1 rRNA 2'-O-methyltransferase fibrillarin-like [Selaginella moellendorffii]
MTSCSSITEIQTCGGGGGDRVGGGGGGDRVGGGGGGDRVGGRGGGDRLGGGGGGDRVGGGGGGDRLGGGGGGDRLGGKLQSTRGRIPNERTVDGPQTVVFLVRIVEPFMDMEQAAPKNVIPGSSVKIKLPKTKIFLSSISQDKRFVLTYIQRQEEQESIVLELRNLSALWCMLGLHRFHTC